ncbi:uncharacterized protein LOC142550237 [Primulina tabacum]|uniref:uncharacterized protein LOC142550237 n=1 Tax=Primulina tabacum TaxID=48773 RepID=UPI003F591BE7
MANKMRIYGEDMKDVKVGEKILRSLTEKFNYVVCSIEESNDIDALTEEEVVVPIDEEEEGEVEQTSTNQLWSVTDAINLDIFEFDKEEEMLLMSYVELYEAKREDAWFLDSGCSHHMCGDQTMFNELNENFRHSVKLGNNTRMDVMGNGSVKLLLDGVNHVVAEVYYIPELRNNLLSIGLLQERGLTILIKGGMCKIFHPRKGLIIQTNMSANWMFISCCLSLKLPLKYI